MGLNLFRRKATFQDDEIELVISPRDMADDECGITGTFTFFIYPAGKREYAGYVSLRTGESGALYYLGHIGYRIEEKYRGHHYALKACRLILPLAEKLGMESITITANPENIPSRKTCEQLGCVLESIVDVPQRYSHVCANANQKCRYIWQVRGTRVDLPGQEAL